jgi:hypothetical protein
LQSLSSVEVQSRVRAATFWWQLLQPTLWVSMASWQVRVPAAQIPRAPVLHVWLLPRMHVVTPGKLRRASLPLYEQLRMKRSV